MHLCVLFFQIALKMMLHIQENVQDNINLLVPNDNRFLHCDNRFLHCDNRFLHCDNRFLHCDNRFLHCDNRFLYCITDFCIVITDFCTVISDNKFLFGINCTRISQSLLRNIFLYIYWLNDHPGIQLIT